MALGLPLGVLLLLITAAFLTTLTFRWITTLALLTWVLMLADGIGAALLLSSCGLVLGLV